MLKQVRLLYASGRACGAAGLLAAAEPPPPDGNCQFRSERVRARGALCPRVLNHEFGYSCQKRGPRCSAPSTW